MLLFIEHKNEAASIDSDLVGALIPHNLSNSVAWIHNHCSTGASVSNLVARVLLTFEATSLCRFKDTFGAISNCFVASLNLKIADSASVIAEFISALSSAFAAFNASVAFCCDVKSLVDIAGDPILKLVLFRRGQALVVLGLFAF